MRPRKKKEKKNEKEKSNETQNNTFLLKNEKVKMFIHILLIPIPLYTNRKLLFKTA